MTILPDVLAPELRVLFCGTAAGAASARHGAYYAGPGNAFWPTLYRAGFTPRQLAPREFPQVLEWGLGLTDLAKFVSGSDGALGKMHFDAERLRDIVRTFRPRLLAFTGKRAAAEFLGRPVAYGLLGDLLGGTRLFVLPSPSGAARRHWDEAAWHDLGRLSAAGN